MKSQLSERTVVTLANAGELATKVAQAVLGNEIADTFNGNPLTSGVLYNMAQVEFQAAVSSKLGV